MAGALQQKIDQVRWFHQIDLGDGIVTPGPDATGAKMAGLGLPEDLTGCSVLDIGAWDGAFSFEAERRGADRVLATDSDACRHAPRAAAGGGPLPGW